MAADALGYLPVRGVLAVVSVATVVILVRLMTPAQYGTYVVLLTCSALLSTCVFNWVTMAAFRFYEEAQSAKNLPGLYRELAWAYLLMAGVWITVGGAIIGLVANGVIEVPAAAVTWLVLLGLLEPIVVMYQNANMAGRHIGNVAAVTLSDALLRAVLGVCGAFLFEGNVAGVLAGQFVASGLVVSVLAFHSRSKISLGWGPANRKRVWAFVSYGYPMAGASLSSWGLSVSDRLLVNWMLGTSAVGIYSAGYQLGSNAILFPSSSMMAGAFPVLIREYEREGRAAAAQLLTKLVTGALIVGCALVIFLAISSHALVNVLFGDSYSNAAAIIPIVALGQLLMALSEYFAKGFQLTRQTSTLFQITLIAACVNVLANLALIPWLGIMGAAIATVIAYSVSLGLTAIRCQRFLTVRPPIVSVWKIALAAIGPLWVLFWFWPSLGGMDLAVTGFIAVASVVLFAATLWVFREPTVVAVAKIVLGSRKFPLNRK